MALTAKAVGFGRVVACDVAERSALVGRGLLGNSSLRLSPASVLRLFDPAPDVRQERPRVLARLPAAQGTFLEGAWAHLHGGTFVEVERDLVALLLVKWLLRYFPLGLAAATDAPRIARGDFDAVTARRLAHYVGRGRRLLQPGMLLAMAGDINGAILPGRAEFTRADALGFLPSAEADVVYLDPPYAGTQAYEQAFRLIDDFLGEEPSPSSAFSSKRPPLDDLLAACAQIPVLLLSLNNTILDEDGVRALVARHRPVRRVQSLPYRHYGAVASPDKRAESREFLVLATQDEARG